MNRLKLALLSSLLLIVAALLPSQTAALTICEKDCKTSYRQCVRDLGDRPVCEAGYAFCLECCTGGC